MPSALLATTLMIALGQAPGQLPPDPDAQIGAENYPVPDNGSAINGTAVNGGYPNGGPPANAFFANAHGNYRFNPAMQPASPGGGPVTDPYLNYDAYEPWVHGYWQELPAFGGYTYFRPYNYRHIYVQSEVAASWGTSAQMPYSQEYYRRGREQGIFEQRTTSIGRPAATGRSGLPFAYRQRPGLNRQPEIIAKASAVRIPQQKPASGSIFQSR
jgi:hypothetical protein